MTELSLAHTGNPFQTGQAEGFAKFLKKTGNVIKKLILNFFELLSVTLIVITYIGISLRKIIYGLFYCYPFPSAPIVKSSIFHICRITILCFLNKYFYVFHTKLLVNANQHLSLSD